MKTKSLSFVLLGVIFMLNACSPFTIITRSEGEQPTPVDAYEPAPAGYQPVTVDQVEVEVGVGSPIPVHVIVSGNLPDPCSQLEHTEIKQDGSNFIISLFATPDIGGPAVDGCIKDAIPFRMSIPLNVVGLPAGSYTVTVNGSRADFNLDTELPTETGCSVAEEVPAVNGQVNYNGISFQLDPALATLLPATTCSAVPLRDDQGPGEAHPPYVAFTFPIYDKKNSDYQPELRIYEVTGDMTQYPFPLNSLSELQDLINKKTEPVTWFNNAPLHTHQTSINFVNGAGVRGLVQYMQDRFFYTNNGLLYEFQGLTQDGHHVVILRFPLQVPFLMELDGFTLPPNNINPQAIAIPEWSDDYEQQVKIIEAYNTEALNRFDQMTDGDTSPNLNVLDALVKSIKVEKP